MLWGKGYRSRIIQIVGAYVVGVLLGIEKVAYRRFGFAHVDGTEGDVFKGGDSLIVSGGCGMKVWRAV